MSYSEVPVRPIGGRLVLDFLNTADWSPDGDVIHEKLESSQDVEVWTKALGVASSAGQMSAAELSILKMVRADLRDIVLIAIDKRAVTPEPFRALRANLVGEVDGPVITLAAGQPRVVVRARLLHLIAASATALLGDPREIGRVKMCAGRACGWLFVDESRNGRRRWCSMATCGNREKARRHHARDRAG